MPTENTDQDYKDLFSSMTGAPAEDEEQKEPTETEPTEPVEEATEPTEPEEETPPVEEEQFVKDARAFQEMRRELDGYRKLVANIQNARGLKNTDEVLDVLSKEALDTQAQQKGMDPETLKRLNDLEEQNTRLEQERKHQATVAAFGLLQTDMGLTQKEVISFAETLQNKGYDIFNNSIPLTELYRGMHFDKLVEKAVSKKEQEILASQKDANTTTPTPLKGGGGSIETPEIKTQEDFRKFLAQQN